MDDKSAENIQRRCYLYQVASVLKNKQEIVQKAGSGAARLSRLINEVRKE